MLQDHRLDREVLKHYRAFEKANDKTVESVEETDDLTIINFEDGVSLEIYNDGKGSRAVEWSEQN